MASNPRRRRFRRNPIRRFRRNPIVQHGFMNNTLVPSAIGAAGAVAVDYLAGVLNLPASMQGTIMTPLVRVGLSIAVGMGVEAVSNSKNGQDAAAGGIIVALYGLFSQTLAGSPLFGGAGGTAGYGYGYGGAYGTGAGMFGAQPGMARYLGFMKNRNLRPRANVLNGLGAGGGGSKFRPSRGQGGSNRLGYIGPARTLGRYMKG